ncbi:CheY-like superfamily [Penicillium waksmanii]|uniref:CheY-like superfamily n=1 Tax=Penicillium waksmanii TaxID=69791 RepID=UPI002548E54E|nr:CheY-like superfamily [Penicillium waksmanii]KAJ5982993.1 CheY-like superfamily [Penicillium waksmanii]
MSSQNSDGCGPENSQNSQTSLDNSNQTLSNSHRNGFGSQNDGRVSSTGLSGSDRIYPIRSLVSMNPINPTPSLTLEDMEESSSHSVDPPMSTIDALPEAMNPYSNPQIPLASHKSISVNDEISSNTPATEDLEHTGDAFGSLETAAQENQTYVTSRFEYAFSEHGHTVMLGDSNMTLKRCEDEPIRTPGAIQSFGVMIALREESPNELVVRAVSENSERIMGISPQQLFDMESFTDVLKEDQLASFLEHLDYVRDDSYDLVIDGPEVFLLAIQGPSGVLTRFWCAIHVSQENKDIIICEFELEEDQLNPLNVEDQKLPETPTSALQTNPPPTKEQFVNSTISASQSVRSIRDARRRKGEAGAMQVFGTLSQIQAQLAQVTDQETLLKVSAGLVRELVGFHRVMVYQFDHQANGRVVAELMDPNVTVDLYQGLHFPASDIPAQARELYKSNKVRLLYNRDHVTARLVCRSLEDLETPLDMSHAYLRAMSPIHTKYLANMEVRSSMSISINAYDNLWGLISCHSYGDDGMRVSFPIRKLCRLVGDTVARNIERITHASDLQARVMVNSVPKEADPSKYIVGSSDDLLRLFQADYGVLSIGNEAKLFGSESNSQEVLALLQYIRLRKVTSVLASHDIGKDFPDFVFRPGFKRISGLLCIPMAPDGAQFIVFFRVGQLTTIKWAGNPYKPTDGGIGPLTPRQSFKEWREITLSESKHWSEFDISTAGVLGSVYGKFIQVWRQKEVLKQNSQLTRLLLANSAHEVRTPLNAVINYLEIAMEGTLDEETRESLARSYSASKSLVYIVNDLLDLATESGQQLVMNEVFELEPTLHDAFDMLAAEAKRKGISYKFKMRPGLPDAVLGDQRRLRQIFVNLISNAIEHTARGGVNVEASLSTVQDDHTSLEMSVIDTGAGMSKPKLEQLFRELEEVYADEHWVGGGLGNIKNSDGGRQRVLGIGLALTARIVHTMHGQLIVKSEEGKGSRLKIILPFQIPGEPSSLSSQNPTKTDYLDMPKSPSLLDGNFISVVDNDKTQNETTLQDSYIDLTSADLGHENGQFNQQEPSLPQNTLPGSEGDIDQKQDIPLRLPLRSEYDESKQLHISQPSPQLPPIKEHSQESPTTSQAHASASFSSNSSLNVLVAEDNPVNSKILHKRLSKTGHTVQLTNNGEACVNAFSSGSQSPDVILMDIQMPIVNGMAATKMIREAEASNSQSSITEISNQSNRVPIFAVSASLVEKDEKAYIDTGFDGWVMKPIDFARLNIILAGITDPKARENVAEAREWEKGGWFDLE